MFSLILATATRAIMPVMLVFAVFILLRGHNEPGGGFVAGLVAATAFALYALANGVHQARRTLTVDPRALIAIGLGLAGLSGVMGLFRGQPFMTSQWYTPYLPVVGKIGTPLFFDMGVMIVVLGVTLTMLFALQEE